MFQALQLPSILLVVYRQPFLPIYFFCFYLYSFVRRILRLLPLFLGSSRFQVLLQLLQQVLECLILIYYLVGSLKLEQGATPNQLLGYRLYIAYLGEYLLKVQYTYLTKEPISIIFRVVQYIVSHYLRVYLVYIQYSYPQDLNHYQLYL